MHAAAFPFAVLEHCPYNYMKPLSQISRPLSSRGEEAPAELPTKHPVTDCHYHAANGDLRATNDRLKPSPPSLGPSFRDLSNEFLAAEMKRDYLVEAFCFLIIVGVSAWPIVSLVRALSLLK